jgi:putative transposase
MVINAIFDSRFTTDPDGRRQLTPEGPYGRPKMTAYLRQNWLLDVAACTVDRCMGILGVNDDQERVSDSLTAAARSF